MLRADAAVIGGTGIGELLAAMGGRPELVSTEFGDLHGTLIDLGTHTVFAVQRHSAGHKVPPHLVNYRAIAKGLQSLAVRGCFSSAAVGSLHLEKGPGTVAICTDMIDLTARNLTLFDQSVSHTDMGDTFPLHGVLSKVSTVAGIETWDGVTYIGANGPRYESPAEIRMMQTLGGDVVGMTATSEAILCREAGVPYACLAVVTNFGCGLSPAELRHGEVTDVMKSKGPAVCDLLLKAATMACA